MGLSYLALELLGEAPSLNSPVYPKPSSRAVRDEPFSAPGIPAVSVYIEYSGTVHVTRPRRGGANRRTHQANKKGEARRKQDVDRCLWVPGGELLSFDWRALRSVATSRATR